MTPAPWVCIVDDSDDLRFLLQRLFKRHYPAYEVATFASGDALLKGLAQRDSLPSLIVLDRHMPGLDGHQTLVLLKNHPDYKDIPVLMMSAAATEQEIQGCYEAGANSFLNMPSGSVSWQGYFEGVFRDWLGGSQRLEE